MNDHPPLHVVEAPPTSTSLLEGEVPTVVIVHGAMDRAASFGRVARQLQDLHLIRYDRRGYGRSVDAGVGTLRDHVDDLFAVLAGRTATVFGHSMGGVIALVAATEAPDQVRSVLAYESPEPWASWWPSPADQPALEPADEAEQFMRRAIGDHYWNRLPARTRTDRRAEGAALQADLASLRGAAPFEYAEVTVPVLAASGSETSWWHAKATQDLAESVPQGEHTVVAGAGHAVHLSHPTATVHLVRRAVERANGVPDAQR